MRTFDIQIKVQYVDLVDGPWDAAADERGLRARLSQVTSQLCKELAQNPWTAASPIDIKVSAKKEVA